MGNRRKSQIQRLPKGERRHAGSKVVVLEPPMEAPARAPDSELSRLSIATGRGPSLPRLDDDALARVLTVAGPPAVLAALSVCVQWRRVAQRLLGDVSRVDLSRIYAVGNGRASPPSYTQVVRTLYQFPNLASLTLQKWLYDDVMEDIADYVCANYAGKALRDVEFAGVLLSGTAVVQLLKNCPNVRSVRLAEHACVSDKLLNEVGSYCKQRRMRDAKFCLQTVKIARTRNVTKTGLAVLLEHAGVNSLIVTKCDGLRGVAWKSSRREPMETLTLASNKNLTRFLTIVDTSAKDVLDLNLSQCVNLFSLEFRSSGVVGTEQPLCLRRLNLSGCRLLREIGLPSYDSPWRFLENLEELILFGVHNLPTNLFPMVFGLSQSHCALPKLRRLDVNGCSLDTLILIGYESLASVDCSGCTQLTTLEIRESWNLETVSVLGRRTPLQQVHLVLPASCVVRGMRSQWHWESYQSNQTITFP